MVAGEDVWSAKYESITLLFTKHKGTKLIQMLSNKILNPNIKLLYPDLKAKAKPHKTQVQSTGVVRGFAQAYRSLCCGVKPI